MYSIFNPFLAFVKILPPKMEPSKLSSIEIKFHSGFSCGSENVLLGVKSKNNSQPPCVFKIGGFERGSVITKDASHCQLQINGLADNLPEIAIYSKSNDKFCLQHVKIRTVNNVDFFRCFIKDFSSFINWTMLDKSCVGSCHYI